MTRTGSSIFARLMTAYTLVVIVALGIAASPIIIAGRGALQRLVTADLELRAAVVLRDVDRYLFDRGQEISAWSTLGIMDDVLIRDQALRLENFLLELQREHSGYFTDLMILDRDESVIASTDFASIGRTARLAELDLRTVPGSELLMGELPVGPAAAAAGLPMAHPISSRLAPEPIGWLVGHVDWSTIEGIVSGAPIGGQPQDAGRFLLLVDASGRIVGKKRAEIAGIPDVARMASSPYVSRRTTERLGKAGTYLVIRQVTAKPGPLANRASMLALWRTDEAYALVRLFVGAVLGSAILGLALAVIASSAIARGISGRIGKLSRGTDALARGDLSYRVDETGTDEIGHLARSFNEMAIRISDAKERLEETLARWQALLTHAPDLIMTVDRKGTIRFANRALPGRGFAEGTLVYDHAQPEYHDLIRQSIEIAFGTGRAMSIEIEGPGGKRDTAWYACRIGPILREGRVENLTVIVTDVTERKRLEKEILEAGELERERIGQDLHDGLGQILTGISLLSKGLHQKLERKAAVGQTEAKQIAGLSNRAIDQARSLARGLHPIALEKAGLRRAAEELAGGVNDLFEVSCRVEGELPEPPPAPPRAMHLFRIAQEAVHNAIRHGKPKNIVIAFTNGVGGSRLTVTDDGVGIPESLSEGQGLGLRLMKHRAQAIGASLEIRRRPEGGTVVICRFR